MTVGLEVPMRVASACYFALAVLPAQNAQPRQEPVRVVASKADDPLEPARRARCAGKYSMLLRQFRAEEPGRGDLAELGHRPAQARFGDEKDLPAAFWVWSRPYWFLFRDGPGRPAVSLRYGADQATGKPDTIPGLEAPSAWCPATKAGSQEWWLLDFGTAVRTTRIHVGQSHG